MFALLQSRQRRLHGQSRAHRIDLKVLQQIGLGETLDAAQVDRAYGIDEAAELIAGLPRGLREQIWIGDDIAHGVADLELGT